MPSQRPSAKEALGRAKNPPGAEAKLVDRQVNHNPLNQSTEDAGTQHTVTGSTVPALNQERTVHRPSLPNAATSRPSGKAPNYKVHILTALSLAFAIRVVALGTKAVIGGS